MANPNAHEAGQPAQIPNPGIAVSMVAENNLKLCSYFLHFQDRTSRTVAAAGNDRDAVRALKDYKLWEETHEDVEAPEINPRDWPRTIEAIEEWLRGHLGVTKIPLAYVVREEIEVLPEADDPEANYTSKQDHLIARAPIQTAAGAKTATYLSDNSRVWELISDLTRDKDCWSYVRPAQRNRDGRAAFQGLKGHYLGMNNVDNMSSIALRKLLSTSYTGEHRRWNFEKYCKVHIDQHSILEGLVEHGYAGIDARSKVHYLCEGIKTNKLEVVKTRILSDATLRSDFEACVNLFQDFIKQSPSEERESNIAAMKTGYNKTGGGGGDAKPDMSVEDRYYTKAEYDKLSPAKKLGLKRERDARGHKTKSKPNKKLDLSEASIKALATAAVSAVQAGQEDQSDGSEPEEDQEIPMDFRDKKQKLSSNRTNSALKRNGKRK